MSGKVGNTIKSIFVAVRSIKRCFKNRNKKSKTCANIDRDIFIGYCWGVAGSAWLAHILNSHEDIMCIHIPDFPGLDYHDYNDLTTILDSIAFTTQDWARGYSLVGFTHGIPVNWHPQLNARYKQCLRGFILTRHPIQRIQSSFALNQTNPQREDEKFWRGTYEQVYQQLIQKSGKSFPNSFVDLGFYLSCSLVRTILIEKSLELPIYKFEDITQRPEVVNALVSYLSNGMYQFEANRVEQLQKKVIAKHAQHRLSVDEIYHNWSEPYKEAYHYFVQDEVIQAYTQLGYTFPHSV